MRTIVVSSHPLADRLPYKAELLDGLVARGADVVLLYAEVGPGSYWRELRRRSLGDVARRLVSARNGGSGPDRAGVSRRPLQDAAAELGLRVERARSLDDEACLRLVESLEPEVVLNVSAMYVPERFLATCRGRVVGAHYAELPRVRGSDTIRWSVVLDVPIVVSHMFLRKELDLGDVLLRTPVSVARGDDIEQLREKCRQASVAGHLAVVDAVQAGTLSTERQSEQDGSMFFRMGGYLRREVDQILSERRYSHYDDVVRAA